MLSQPLRDPQDHEENSERQGVPCCASRMAARSFFGRQSEALGDPGRAPGGSESRFSHRYELYSLSL